MESILKSISVLKSKGYPIESIDKILTAALQAADPLKSVERNLHYRMDQLQIGEKPYLLYPDSRIVVVALGKASIAMTDAAVSQLGTRIFRGVCVCKHLPTSPKEWSQITLVKGNHPAPDETSVNAGKKIKDVVSGLNTHDVVLFLLSGGGSSLACLPAQGISLKDIQELTNELLKSGASINEINTIRKHLDDIKGGGLLKMASPASIGMLVVSDVVGNPLDVIASGPTVADPTTFQNASEIIKRSLPFESIPESVLAHFEKGVLQEISETVKPGDLVLENSYHKIVACNLDSSLKAAKMAKSLGFNGSVLTNELVGDSKLAGEYLATRIIDRLETRRPIVEIAGGETTVKVTGDGIGGRNLEVALAAVRKLSGFDGTLLITLATDGEDVSGDTLTDALAFGLSPEDYLSRNDSYNFFKKLGGLIRTGPTGTNVNDLTFLFHF
jgi:glycerate 2-kinase